MFAFASKLKKKKKPMKIETSVVPTAPQNPFQKTIYKFIGYFKK